MCRQLYDDDFAPEDYADFERAEDRGDLQDLALDQEPCEKCGTRLTVRGAFGNRVLFECSTCDVLVQVEWESDEPDDWYDDEGDEEGE